MAATKGQPAPKPSALKSPVPQKSEIQAVGDDLQKTAESVADDIGDLTGWELNDVATSEGAAPLPVTDADFAPEPGFVQANVEQFQNLGDRVMYGLSANNNEAMAKLQQKYGPQNVTMRKGNIYFRKDATQKFKPIDPDQFEVFADLIPDGARNIIMEAAMLPAEIGGGMAAGPAGAVGGRVASVPLANFAADSVAGLAGIPEDQSRSKTLENLTGMTVEAALPVAGKYLVKPLAKRLPGTQAYKLAKEAAQKEVVALSNQSDEVFKAALALEQEGIRAPLMLNQLQPDSPKVKALTDKVADSPEFIQKQMDFAKDYEAALMNHLNEIGRKNGKTGGNIAETVTNAVRDLERNEGKAIGEYHKMALAATKNQKQALPQEFRLQAKALMDEFGFTYRAGKDGKIIPIPPKDIKPLLGTKGLTKPGEVRSVINALEELGRVDAAGGARLTDLDRLVTALGDLSPKLKGSAAGNAWGKLTGDLRQHRRQVIGDALNDPFDKQAFEVVMNDYSLIRKNSEQLADVLRGDVTSKTLVNSFFKGKENLANVRALRKITQNDPGAWESLKEEFVNQLLIKHSGKSDSLTRFNSGAFLSDLKGQYGDDFLREVFDGPKDIDNLKNLLTYGQRLESTARGIKADNLTDRQVNALTDAGVGFFAGVKFKFINGAMKLAGMGGDKENAFMELMNRDGFHKYIAGWKGGDKSKLAQTLEEALMRYNSARAANKKTAAVLDIGKDITKRAVRADIREDASR